MKSTILALLLAFPFLAATVPAGAATGLLEPGIYKLDPSGYLDAPNAQPASYGERDEDKFERAMPPTAKVTYAVVTRDPDRTQNRVLFLVDKDYHYDVNSPNKLCPAYAFPDWNEYSETQPFCRTNISGDEAAFKWTANAFTVSWGTDRKYLRTESTPPQRKATPAEAATCSTTPSCADAVFGSSHPWYEITHHSDRFELATPRDYQGMLYLTKSVPFFSDNQRSASHTDLAAGAYVAVISAGSQWDQVERFDGNGTPTPGWIDRDDLEDLKWVDQQAATKQFRFRVAFAASEGDADSVVPVAIEVLDRVSGKRVQVIRDFYTDISTSDSATSLELVDANFDGYPDLTIAGTSGGAGPNSTSNFFLFDPKTKRFVFDKTLSDMSQIDIDVRHKLITSAQRNSCCSHSSQTFHYEGGKLVEIANWDESLSADGKWLETTVGKFSNGKMRYRVTRKRAELN
nr:hypothetical protein HUO10_004834 [Paraburkholderia busanensis]